VAKQTAGVRVGRVGRVGCVGRVVALQRRIQRQLASADRKHPVRQSKAAMQAGARRYPAPPMPRQHRANR
jgi:hypothetical protein